MTEGHNLPVGYVNRKITRNYSSLSDESCSVLSLQKLAVTTYRRDKFANVLIDFLIDRMTWTTCHVLSCVVWNQSLARRSKVVKSRTI